MRTAGQLWLELLELIKQAAKYQSAASLSRWDLETNMPKDAGPGRDQVFSLMATKATETFVDPRIGDLIAELRSREDELNNDQRRILGRIEEVHRRARAVPLDLVQEWNETTSRAQRFWQEARRTSNFLTFLPHLKEVLRLLKLKAQALGSEGQHPYDAIVSDFEPGTNIALLQETLLPLRQPLVELVGRVKDCGPLDTSCLTGTFPEAKQIQLSRAILQRLGFDFNAGRIDAVPGHPMTLWVGAKDTRITTRFSREDLGDGLFASIHEGGHGLYQQWTDPIFDWLFFDTGISMAIHESQSRMYENIVGRGMPFWRFFFPVLRTVSSSFDQVTLDGFWRAINAVRPSLIRIHADEVTYPLHVLLRFELEQALLNDDLQPADLPEAWNQKMEEYLGIRPTNDAKGCLQDVHWSQGYIGYFPTYVLGTLLAAQLWETIVGEIPEIKEKFSHGDFAALLQWLREKVHRWGYSYTLPELALQATGRPLDPSVWLKYIGDKCAEVYNL
jgi:carboxypeptidase Taq